MPTEPRNRKAETPHKELCDPEPFGELSPEEIRVSQRVLPKFRKGRWAFTGLLCRMMPASLLAREKKPRHNNLGT